ncbi:LytTR family transcriptional regulator [Algoriphagus ratkowskyi]|nr:LytTR family transcriptional regulator [Algoriphagus ratkowskyi]
MYGASARFLDSLTSASFYIKLLATIFIAGFFLEFVHRITVKLDKVYDWKERPLVRLTLQFILGVFLPGMIDFFFLSVYKWYFELTSIHENPGSHSNVSAMILPVFLFNLYYLFYYHILRRKDTKTQIKDENELLLIQQGNRTIPVLLKDIRYIYHKDRLNYLIISGDTRYFLSEPLDELERQLPDRDFFRVNRKMIIHFRACIHFQSNGHGKLLLRLDPSFDEEVAVSQSKARKFREWIRR